MGIALEFINGVSIGFELLGKEEAQMVSEDVSRGGLMLHLLIARIYIVV